MKIFYKSKHGIVLMIVLTLMMQIVGPVMGNYVYAGGKVEQEGFSAELESIIDGKAIVNWEYKYDPDGKMVNQKPIQLNFNLMKGEVKRDVLDSDEGIIGEYIIFEDGEMTVEIDEEAIKELLGEPADEIMPMIPLEPAKPVEEVPMVPLVPAEQEVNDIEDEPETPKIDGEETDSEDDSGRIINNVLGMFSKNVVYAEEDNNDNKPYIFKGSFQVEGVSEKVEEGLSNKPMAINEVERDISNIEGFNYEVNLYADGTGVVDGGSISIEELTTLDYKVTFDIDDNFEFTNGDYLNLDIAALLNLSELDISELTKEGRIIFEIRNKENIVIMEIDAAKYVVDEASGMLKIVFDKGEDLNNVNGREGYAQLEFNISETSEELEIVEEIKLEGKETKTFIIIRENKKGVSLSKEGNYLEAEDEIVWTIDVNTSLDKLNNAIVVDEIPSELRVKKIEIIDLKVTTKEVTEVGTWVDMDFHDISDENKLELVLGDLNRKAKRIKITTSINYGVSGAVTVTNKATLKSDGEVDITVEAPLKFSRVTGMSKNAELVKDSNEIEWTIEFRGSSNSGTSEILDTLTFPENIKLVLDKTSVKLGDLTMSEGNIDIQGNIITFKEIPNSTELQTLKYKTKVIYENNNTGEFPIGNEAVHNGNSAESSVSIGRGEVATKDNGRIYGDDGNTFIEWEIHINKNNEDWQGIEIWEYVPEGFEFISATSNNENQILDSTGTGTDGDKEYQKIKLNTNINKEEIITVTMKLINTIKDIENVTNKAKIRWHVKGDYEGIIGGTVGTDPNEMVVEGTFTKDRFQHNISKTSTNPNYTNSTIDWTVDYKTYNQDVKGLVIKDELTGEQKYDEDTFVLTLNGNKLEDTDYNLTFNAGKEFTLTLNDNITGSDKYNYIKLKYTTKFDLTKMEDIDAEIKLKNSVEITNDGSTLPTSSNETITKDISKNGSKSVAKQSDGNRIFNWTVKLNHKGKTIDKEKIIGDTLTGEQKYLKDSIEIYRAQLDKDGSLIKVGEDVILELIEEDGISYIESDGYHTGMTIKFKEDLTTPIVIEYQTDAAGISEGWYKNDISYNGKSYPASIRYTEYNEFITKELLNDRNGKVVKGDVLKWKLIINTSLSEIHDFVLEDIMSDGLVFIEDSLVIDPAGDHEIIQGKLDGANADKQGFKLYSQLVDRKHTITYETLVTGDKDSQGISNDVIIKGTKIEKVLEDKKTYAIVGRAEAGGSGYLDNDYELTIIKVDQDGNIITSPVEFELITKTNIGDDEPIIMKEILTTENGKIIIKIEENKYNKYFIKEIKAPEGYVLEEKEIEIRFEDAKEEKIEIEVVNTKKINIKATKRWVNGSEEKPTIWFKLYRHIQGEEKEEVINAGIKKLVNGTIEVEWTELEKIDTKGNEYIYSVREVNEDGDDSKPVNHEKAENGLEVTNTYVSPTDASAKAIKEWKNGPQQRPTIWFKLYREIENGDIEEVPLEEAPIKELKSGITEVVWSGLKKTDSTENEYIFSVKEVDQEGNDLELDNYTKVEEGLRVTNTYVIPKTNVRGRKEWIGGPSRKPTIELQLYKDGVAFGSPVRLVDGVTEYTWTKLDQTDINGRVHRYTVDEVRVPGDYWKSISRDGLTITNRYDPYDPYYPPTDPTDPDPTDPPKEDPKDPDKPVDPEDPETPDPTDPTDPDQPGTEDPVDPDPAEPTESTDPEPPTTIVLDPPTKGSVTVDENGNWTYTPNPGATGEDSFTIVHPDGREELIEIDLDDLPLGTREVTKETLKKLPKTGAVGNLGFYFAGLSLIFLGIFLRKRIA